MKKVLRVLLVVVLVIVITPIAIVFLRPSLIVTKDVVRKDFAQANSHFYNWRGAEIHYVDEGQGPTILMIHGFGGHHRNFQKLADELKGEFRVVRVDLPGFGLSDCPTPQDPAHPRFAQMYRDFMHDFIDTVHLDSVYVIGNSMGGMVAWNMAALRPDKVQKLVLLASAGYDLEKVAKGLTIIKYSWIGTVFEKGMPHFMSESGARRCYADESKLDMAEVERNNEISNREGNLLHMLAMARDTDFPDTAVIKQVQCPTLIIWGKEDKIVPVEHAARFERDIPNSKVIYYSPCGHVPMIERTEDVKRDFLEFIKE